MQLIFHNSKTGESVYVKIEHFRIVYNTFIISDKQTEWALPSYIFDRYDSIESVDYESGISVYSFKQQQTQL